MARKLKPKASLESLRDEIVFTLGMVRAEPLLAGQVCTVEEWLASHGLIQAEEQTVRDRESLSDAQRMYANVSLDEGVIGFGRDLLAAVSFNRLGERWLRFFSKFPPSKFITQPLKDEVAGVKAWVAVGGEPVLDLWKERLTAQVSTVGLALDETEAVRQVQAAFRVKREGYAADLTQRRDALERAIAEIGEKNGKPRDWAGNFFRKVARKSGGSDVEEGGEAPVEEG